MLASDLRHFEHHIVMWVDAILDQRTPAADNLDVRFADG